MVIQSRRYEYWRGADAFRTCTSLATTTSKPRRSSCRKASRKLTRCSLANLPPLLPQPPSPTLRRVRLFDGRQSRANPPVTGSAERRERPLGRAHLAPQPYLSSLPQTPLHPLILLHRHRPKLTRIPRSQSHHPPPRPTHLRPRSPRHLSLPSHSLPHLLHPTPNSLPPYSLDPLRIILPPPPPLSSPDPPNPLLSRNPQSPRRTGLQRSSRSPADLMYRIERFEKAVAAQTVGWHV